MEKRRYAREEVVDNRELRPLVTLSWPGYMIKCQDSTPISVLTQLDV